MATHLLKRFYWIFFAVMMLASLVSTQAQAQCPTGSQVSFTNVTCPGASDGTATVIVSGGVPNYVFVLQKRVGIASYSFSQQSPEISGTTHTFTGVAPGNYRFEIFDSQVDTCIPIYSEGFIIGTTGTTPADVVISGTASVCHNQTGVTFSVPLTAGSSYAWSVPADASITAGATGPENNSITVAFGTTSGQVKVIETNSGGCKGKEASLNVSVVAPPTVFALDPDGLITFCEGSAGAALGLDGSQTDVTYSLLRNGSAVATATGTGSALSFGMFDVAGVYTVTARGNSVPNCSAAMSGTVTLQSVAYPVAPTATTPAAICAGGNVDPISITTADPSFNIRIFRNAALTDEVAGATASFDPDTDTPYYNSSAGGTYTYYITQSNSGCMSTAAVVNVVVNPLANATFADKTPSVCSGSEASLLVNFTAGTAPFSLTYDAGAGDVTVSGINSSSHTIELGALTAEATVMLKSVSDANSCEQTLSESVTVSITQLPDVTLAAFAEYCQSSDVLTLTGGLPEGGTYFVNGTAQASLSLTTPGDYTITYRYTDPSTGCTNTSEARILTINSLPDVSFSMSQVEFCLEDAAVSLSGTPAGGVFSGNGVSGNSFNPKNAGTGFHDLVYTYQDGNSCVNTATVRVEVKPMLEASLSIQASSNTLCAGEEVTFSIASSENMGTQPVYEWLLIRGGTETVVSDTETYTTASLENGDAVQLRYAQGTLTCGAANTGLSNVLENFTVREKPAAAWTSEDVAICAGGSTSLALNISAGAAPYTILYSATNSNGSQTFTANFAAAGANTIPVTPAENTTYTLVSISDANSCSQALSGSIVVTVNATEQIAVSIAPATPEVCPNEAVTFTATVTNEGTGISYQWYLDGNPVGSSSNTYTLASPAHNNRVYLVVTQGTVTCPGASLTATSNEAVISVKEVNPAFSGPAEVCIATGAQYVPQVSGGIFSSDPAGAIDASTGQFSPSASGVYTIYYTLTQNGCTDVASLPVTVNPAVDPKVTLSAGVAEACEGGSVVFTAVPEDAGTNPVYQWFRNGVLVEGESGATYTASNASGTSLEVEVRVSRDPAATACISSAVASDTETITINPNPTVALAVSGESTICSGETTKLAFTFSGTAPFTLVYNDGTNNYTVENITTNPLEIEVSPAVTTTYTVVSLQDSKCAATTLPEGVEVEIAPAPAASPVVSATEDGCTSFSLSWAAVTNAADYLVEVSTAADLSAPFFSQEITGTSQQVSGLSRGVVYYYRVTARNSCDVAAVSQIGNIELEQIASPVAAEPSAATISCESFQASWSAVSGATTYTVEIAAENTFATILESKTVNAPATAETFSGLTANTQYYYRVRANAACGSSINSNIISATTNALQQADLAFSITPATVATGGKLQLAVVTTSGFSNLNSLQLTASWQAAENLQYLGVLSSALDGANITVDQATGIISLDWSSATAVSLAAGEALFTLEFNAAVCGEVNFGFGNALTATSGQCPVVINTTGASHTINFGGQPQALAASEVGCVSFTANWTAVDAVTSYTIEIADNDAFAGSSLRVIQNITTTSYNVTGLLSGTTYYYRVQAVSSCGVGPYSNAIEQMTNEGITLKVPVTASACEGQTLNFSAELIDGATYAWEGPAGYIGDTHEVRIENAQTENGGTYQLTVSKDGCTSVYEVNVSVNPVVTPTVSVEVEGEVSCATTSLNLVATATNGGEGALYSWYVGNETTARQATTDNTFQIAADELPVRVRVVLTSTLPCAVTEPVAEDFIDLSIPATPLPVLTAGGNDICFGEAIEASATGENLVWEVRSAGNVVYTTTGPTLEFTPSAAGGYTVAVTQQPAGCQESQAVTYSIKVRDQVAAPSLEQNPLTLCQGTGATVTATGSNVVWYSDAALTTVASDNEVLSLAADLAAGDYTYYAVASADNCSSTATVLNVKVITAPIVDLGADVALCAPAEVTLNSGYSTDAYEIVWRKSDGSVVAENEASITVSTTDTYTVTVTDRLASCATDTDEVVVTIAEEITITAGLATSEALTCNSTSVTINATTNAGADATFVWLRNGAVIEGEEGSSLSLNSFADGDEITVNVTSKLSCAVAPGTATASITLDKNATAAPEIAEPVPASVCAGTEISLNAIGTNIKWYIKLGAELLETREGNSLSYTPAQNNVTYTFEATQTVDGCPESAPSVVNVEVKPVVATPELSHTEVIVCADETLPEISATGTGIRWYADAALTQLQNEGSILAPAALAAGTSVTYYAIATDGDCRSQAAQVRLERLPELLVDLGTNIAACAPADVTLNSGYTTDNYVIVWYASDGSIIAQDQATLTVSNSGTYSVVVTDRTTNCAGGDAVNVTIENEITPEVTVAVVDPISCATTSVNLQATAVGGGADAVYSWFVGSETTARQATTANTFAIDAAELPVQVRVVLTSSLDCANTSQPVEDAIDLAVPATEVPVITAATAAEICIDQQITGTAEGENLLWTVVRNSDSQEVHNQSGASLSYQPDANGSYTVSVTQQPAGCARSEAATFVVTVTDEITITASLSTSEVLNCNSTTVTINASTNAGADATYQWLRGGTVIAAETGSSLSLSSFTDGEVIEVNITSALSCASGPATASITLNKNATAAPEIAEPVPASICAGQSISLTATGENITWYIKVAGNLLETISGNNLNYTPAQNGVTYTFEATQTVGGCPESAADAVTVEVKPVVAAPTLAQTDVTICQGTATTVTATGTAVVWYSDAALTTVVSDNEVLNLAADLAAGDYTYYAVASADNCSSTATVLNVKVITAPVVDLGADVALCAPAEVTLNSGYTTDNYEIVWFASDGSIIAQNEPTVTVSATDTYRVTVTDRRAGCALGSDQVLVEIETVLVPTVAVVLDQPFTCSSSEIVFRAEYSRGGTAPTFIWKKNFEVIEGATAGTLTLTVGNFSNGDDITVEMTSALDCADPKVVASEVYDIVYPTPVAPALTFTEATACVGGTMPTYASATGASLNWYLGAPDGTPDHVGATFTPAESLEAGDYTFYATETTQLCGESPQTSFTLKVQAADQCESCTATPTVALRILPGNEICPDVKMLKLIADVAQVGENAQYAWFYKGTQISAEASPVIELAADAATGDVFRVEVTITDAAFICNGVNKVSDEETLTISNQVQATLAIEATAPVCKESTAAIRLTASGTNIDFSYAGLTTSYLWDIDGVVTTTTTNTLEVVPSQLTAGLVKLTVVLPAEMACVLTPAEATYQIEFATEQPLAVNLSSSAPNGVCPGTALTFTASAPDAGLNPEYTFFLTTDGVEAQVQSGSSNTYTLTDPKAAQQLKVSVRVTDPAVVCRASTATSAPVAVQLLSTEECLNNNVSCGPFTIKVTELQRPSCAEDNGKLVLVITSKLNNPFRLAYTLGERTITERIEASADVPYTLTVDKIPAQKELVVTLGDDEQCVFRYVLEEAPRLSAALTKSAGGDIKCYGESSGKAVLTVTGGNAPYQYLLEGSSTWQTMNGNTLALNTLPAGISNVLVRQNESDICPATASVEILNLGTPIEIVYTPKPANCNDESGAISLTSIIGGYGSTYRVKMNNGVEKLFVSGQNTVLEFTGLTRGRHTLYITDEQGCQTSKTVVVPSPGLIALTPEMNDPFTNSTAQVQYSGVIPYNCEVPHLLNGLRLVIDKELTDFTEVGYDFIATYKKLDVANAEEKRVEFKDEHVIYGLEKGRYQVIISAKSEKGCPENRVFEIKGNEAPSTISFKAEPGISCDNTQTWIRISELMGDVEKPFIIIVQNLEREEVARRVLSRTDYIEYTYWDVQVPAKGSYEIKVEQDQTSCENNESSAVSGVIRINEIPGLYVKVTGTTESMPDRATGSLSFNIRNGSGTAPYTASLVWVARVEGQEEWVFESNGDPVPMVNVSGKYDFTYNNLPPGLYELTITDAKGCTYIINTTADGKPLMIDYDKNLFIPNVITPNGDNINDVFYIRNKPANSRLTITNRWGKVVYEAADYQNDWNGDNLVEGIYYYSLLVPNSETGVVKGWIQIKRGASPR